MSFQLNIEGLDDNIRAFYQQALACEMLAEQASSAYASSSNIERLQDAARHYEEAANFIRHMIELLPEEKLTPEIQIWLYDTEALRFHCLGDCAYATYDYQNYVEHHEKSADARRQALQFIPEDDAFAASRLFHLGRMFYVMGDAQDGRAILLEQEGKWGEAAKAREEERNLKEKEFECLQQVLPHERIFHHVSRFWSAGRSRLQCLAKQAELDNDFQRMLECLRDAAHAAEQARQATPDWAPYTQICRQLQREIDQLMDEYPELAEGESVNALMIKYLGKGVGSNNRSLDEIITSLDEIAARKRKHLIPRCFKTGTPFCPYRLEEVEGQVFIGMPFRPEYENVFEFGVRPGLEDVGLRPWKGNEIISNIDIMCKMCRAIQQSPYAVVNISDWNPNVMFELGLLYAMHKHVLLIKDRREDVPVDLSGMEYVEYSRFEPLRERVHNYFARILQQGDHAPRKCFKLGVLYCAMNVEEDPQRVFVAMPFRDEQQNMYLYALKPAVERAELQTWKADEDLRNVDIMCKTCQSIQRSPYGVTDITGWNPNVMFELGLLYGHGKKVVLIKKVGDEVPVDLQGLEYIEYDDYTTLRQRLEKYLVLASR